MLARLFLIESSAKLLVTRTGIKAWMSSISGLWFPWPIYMFFERRFDLGTLDSGEQSLPFGLLVVIRENTRLKHRCPLNNMVLPCVQKVQTGWQAGPGSLVGCTSAWYSDGCGSDPPVWQDIPSRRLVMKSLSLPLIQVGQLSVTSERMCTKYWLTA